jgi:hypothetical protein
VDFWTPGCQPDAASAGFSQRVCELRTAQPSELGILERHLGNHERVPAATPGLDEKDLRHLVEGEEIAMETVAKFSPEEAADQGDLLLIEGWDTYAPAPILGHPGPAKTQNACRRRSLMSRTLGRKAPSAGAHLALHNLPCAAQSSWSPPGESGRL